MVQNSLFHTPGGVIDLGGLGGASGARKLEVVDSSIYASKVYTPAKPYMLVSETVCAELAIALNLPFPAYSRISFDNKDWFGLEWRPNHRNFKQGMEAELVNSADLPAMFAFDVLVCNIDRNKNNIVFQKVSPILERYRFVMIDHGHALGGNNKSSKDFLQGVEAPEAYLRFWPELRATIDSPKQFEPFFERVSSLTRTQMVEIVDAVPKEWRPNPDDIAYLVDFLTDRAAGLRALMSNCSHMFPNIV